MKLGSVEFWPFQIYNTAGINLQRFAAGNDVVVYTDSTSVAKIKYHYIADVAKSFEKRSVKHAKEDFDPRDFPPYSKLAPLSPKEMRKRGIISHLRGKVRGKDAVLFAGYIYKIPGIKINAVKKACRTFTLLNEGRKKHLR